MARVCGAREEALSTSGNERPCSARWMPESVPGASGDDAVSADEVADEGEVCGAAGLGCTTGAAVIQFGSGSHGAGRVPQREGASWADSPYG